MVACLSCPSDALSRRSPLFLLSSYTKNRDRASSSNRRRLGCSKDKALILLQNCTNFNHLKLIHAKIIRNGLSLDQLLVRKLLQLCFSFGKMEYAIVLFNFQYQVQKLPHHSFTWNFMIRLCTIHGNSQQALLLYNLMICLGFPPDKFTFPFVIKACLASCALHKAKEVHGLAIKTGFFKDTFLHNNLIDLYFKCRDVDSGRKVFDKMRVRNVVSWTTFVAGLLACGELDAARGAFDRMPTRNVVSWTAMIQGYVSDQQPQEAFQLFWSMQLHNVMPNEFTLVCLLKACTQLWSLRLGAWIHDFALKNGFQLGAFLGTALIDMYSKCGSLADARQVFDKMPIKNLATWNAMITSLGVHGCGQAALTCFAQMKVANVQPDAITFVGVLCACVHTNNVPEGDRYFKYMTQHYGITPILEHYTCMIELYARANMSSEICKLVNAMPVKLNNNTTAALIGPSIVDGIADVEKPFGIHARELHWLEMHTCYSPEHQLPCFKWDVG